MTGVHERATTSAIDPILTTVVQRKLEAIAEDTARTLLRTTRSSLLSQAGDLGTAVLDADGRLLAGAEYVPILALSLKYTCEATIARFDGDVRAGDVILHNDVFSGSPQNSDIGVLVPVFAGDELVAWVATRGHQLDIGGPVAGGCNPMAEDVWQEALRIPPVKVVEGGTPRSDVWDLIFANIRAREIVEADMRAQVGACMVGERELRALVDKHGVTDFRAHCDALLNASEHMMRSAIADIPDGSYVGESVVNADMRGTLEQHRIRVKVTVTGTEIALDYDGTAPQTSGYVNAPLASSASASVMALFGLVQADIPHNDGVLRAITLDIPAGTMLNAQFPAATFYGNFMSVQVYEAIMDAMREAVPDAVSAGWNRAYDIRSSGVDRRTGRRYHDIHFLGMKGGTGAVRGMDGYNQGAPVFCPALRTQDYELSELQHPHFLIRHEYLADSAGAGRWRGGLGVHYECRLDGDDLTGVTQGDGLLAGAFGVHGGGAGAPNRIELVAPDGTVREARAMEVIEDVARGTVIRQQAGGGGGYGDPLERSIDAVRRDVEDGIVSVEAAHRRYGVVVSLPPDGIAVVDEPATDRTRRELRAARSSG